MEESSGKIPGKLLENFSNLGHRGRQTCRKHWVDTALDLAPTLDGQNRQSPIASVQRTRSTLASHSAVPCGSNVKGMNANRAI